MSNRAKYLITGGGGFIGSSIASALLAKGERVRILDDFSTGRRSNIEGFDVELIEGSILDSALLARAASGVEVIFHQAALPSVPRSIECPLESDRVNTHGTLMVLEAARLAGVRRVVFAGSSSAYGNTPTLPKHEDMIPRPLSPYATAKVAGEMYMQVYAVLHTIETVTLRYFNVFGARQDPNGAYAAVISRWATAALTGQSIQIFGDGQQTRDFCFIENVVHANLLAASTTQALCGDIINISCGEQISLLALADAIEAEVGQPLRREFLPSRAGDVHDSFADISKAKRILNYVPQVFWQEGLKRTIKEMRTAVAAI